MAGLVIEISRQSPLCEEQCRLVQCGGYMCVYESYCDDRASQAPGRTFVSVSVLPESDGPVTKSAACLSSDQDQIRAAHAVESAATNLLSRHRKLFDR